MRKRVQAARAFMLLAAAGAVTTGILAGPPAEAVTGQQIVNVGSGECLAVLSNFTGTEAVQEPCSTGDSSELWTFVSVCTSQGCTNQYQVKNTLTSHCLAPASTTSVPVTVTQATCSTSVNDAWKKQSSSTGFEITSDVDGASMHPNSNSNTSGAVIYVNFATTNNHYLWKPGLSI